MCHNQALIVLDPFVQLIFNARLDAAKVDVADRQVTPLFVHAMTLLGVQQTANVKFRDNAAELPQDTANPLTNA